jgi:hypothetical protein
MAMIMRRYSDPQSSVAEACKSRHIRIGASAHHHPTGHGAPDYRGRTTAPLHLSDSVTSCFSLDTRPGLEY